MFNRTTMVYQAKVVGQEDLRAVLTVYLLAGGHVLAESVPGLAKTTAAQTLASAVSGTFHRIRCTPDLVPNDITGSQIWSQASGEVVTQLGPVHASLVLVDEINRSSAKTQSTMLEAIQEGQVTISGVNHRLSRPLMVMATQNPTKEEGTYVLPEAQMDHFLFKEIITCPVPVEELEVLERIGSGIMSLSASSELVSIMDVLPLQGLAQRIYIHSTLKAYIVDIINTTRGTGPNPLSGWARHVCVGVSPRSTIALVQISQALVLMDEHDYVVPDSIKKLCYGTLRHCIIRTFNTLADNVSVKGLADTVFSVVPVP